jgi:hypothetical protein
MYWPAASGILGCGPRGFGDEVSPFPDRTKTRLPSRENAAAVGYQPDGRKPETRLSPGRDTSATATVLLSALAMRSVAPSGERPSPLGVEPGGALG